jgi:pimeloyl-ACP methyl ester carboxylesterase
MERRTSSSPGREAVETFEALAARLRAGRAARSRQGTPRQLSRPSTSLAERWTTVDGVRVFFRETPRPEPGTQVMVHLHGFGLSGRYLLPTAERLSGEFHTLVPDLPGFGRSGNAADPLDVTGLARAAAAFLDTLGIERASFVGNSMGCAVICEIAHHFPEKVDRAVLVAPAGGMHNQPLGRAVTQLARDGIREPVRLVGVAAPDYLRFGVPSTLRLFQALTRFPALDRLLAMDVPTMAVVGSRDPLMPLPARLREVAGQTESHALLVVIEGAAHAINFSHPGELANVIRQFMDDLPIVDDPDLPGLARAYELHRGPAPVAPGRSAASEERASGAEEGKA